MVSVAVHRYIFIFVVFTKINGRRYVLWFGISNDKLAYTDFYGLNDDGVIDNRIFDVSIIFFMF